MTQLYISPRFLAPIAFSLGLAACSSGEVNPPTLPPVSPLPKGVVFEFRAGQVELQVNYGMTVRGRSPLRGLEALSFKAPSYAALSHKALTRVGVSGALGPLEVSKTFTNLLWRLEKLGQPFNQDLPMVLNLGPEQVPFSYPAGSHWGYAAALAVPPGAPLSLSVTLGGQSLVAQAPAPEGGTLSPPDTGSYNLVNLNRRGVTLSWFPSAGAKGYLIDVYRDPGGNADLTLLASGVTPANQNAYTALFPSAQPAGGRYLVSVIATSWPSGASPALPYPEGALETPKSGITLGEISMREVTPPLESVTPELHLGGVVGSRASSEMVVRGGEGYNPLIYQGVLQNSEGDFALEGAVFGDLNGTANGQVGRFQVSAPCKVPGLTTTTVFVRTNSSVTPVFAIPVTLRCFPALSALERWQTPAILYAGSAEAQLSASGREIVARHYDTTEVLSLQDGAQLAQYTRTKLDGQSWGMFYLSPDLQQAVLPNSEQKVVLWNVLENRLARVLDYPPSINSWPVSWSPDGSRFVVYASDFRAGQQVVDYTLFDRQGAVIQQASQTYGVDGQRLIPNWSSDNTLQIMGQAVTPGGEVRTLSEDRHPLSLLSPDSKRLLVVQNIPQNPDGTFIKIYRLSDGQLEGSYTLLRTTQDYLKLLQFKALAWSPDSTRVVAALGADPLYYQSQAEGLSQLKDRLVIFGGQSAQPMQTLLEEVRSVSSLSWLNQGDIESLVLGHDDGGVSSYALR